ncbi:MAG: Ada metal-binding domain-containing protein [Gammaproteobacteria bacterium]
MNASPNTEQPSEVATEKDPRWAAVVARDRGTDGKFYYSVKTTGVYCRPSCASRFVKPEYVQFHATCVDAEQAGFRPCKRCKPDQPSLVQQHAKKVAEVCRLIEGAEETLSLSELSSKAGLRRGSSSPQW